MSEINSKYSAAYSDIDASTSPEPSNYSKNDDDSIDNEAEQITVSKEFQENVIKFVKLDDLIRKKQKEMNELKQQRKPCEEFILKYLDEIGESTVDISNGKLRKNKSETLTPLTKDIIKDSILGKVGDPKIADEILKQMEKRPKKTNVNLKRTKKRAPKKK